MSDSDYLAFSKDSPSPQRHSGGPAGYQPYPRPQQRRWQQNNQQQKFNNHQGQGNRFFNHSGGNNRFHNQSGGNRFHNQHQHDNSYTSPVFDNTPDRQQQFQNYSNTPHGSCGGKPFRGRPNNNGRQRAGFGFQQRNFSQHSNGNSFQKSESYFHISMVEDPWSWFDDKAHAKDDSMQIDHSEEPAESSPSSASQPT